MNKYKYFVEKLHENKLKLCIWLFYLVSLCSNGGRRILCNRFLPKIVLFGTKSAKVLIK